MSDQFTTYWDPNPVPIGVAPEPIHASTAPLIRPKAVLSAEPAVIQRFVNDEQNSRLAVPLGEPSARAIRWKSPLPDSLLPAGLLTLGDRILVYGALWRLFDAGGQPIQGGAMGTSSMISDVSRGLFFAVDQFGLIAARRSSDGAEAFAVSLYGGRSFERTYFARRGRLLISSGFELALDAHEPSPELSALIIADLGDPAHQKNWDEEGGPVVVRDLQRATQRLLTAMHGDSIYLATDDRVYVLDLELKFKHVLTGSFVPLALSLDESGHIYMNVATGGKAGLWSLSPSGERSYEFDLPPGSVPTLPPIIDYDHTVYLAAGSYLYSVGQDGKLNWSRQASGIIRGAAITADGQLLTAEGSQIAVWNATGERKLLHSFPGESLEGSPILMANGDLLAVTRTNLYCLAQKP